MGEPSRLRAMGRERSRLSSGANERASAHDVLAPDDEPVDPVRAGEDEPRDGVVGPAELQPVGRPDREVRLLPASSEPMSSRPSTAAPPRVPSRSASRTVIASPPSRPRATRSACFTSRREGRPARWTPSRRRRAPPALRPRGAPDGRDARPEAEVRGRAVRDTHPRRGEAARPRRRERWTQWAHHTSSASQPRRSRYSTGRAAVQLPAVRLLLDRLGEVRVQLQAEPAGERGRLLEEPAR